MAEQEVTLAPGESKAVSFEAIPHEAKVYQVTVNGLTGSFVAIPPPVGDFVYSNEFFELRSYRELVPGAGAASCYVVFRCTITNHAGVRGTRTIRFYYQQYSTYYKKFYNPVLARTFELTLEPGESYQFIFDPRRFVKGTPEYIADLLVLAHGSFIWYVFLLDSAGGESAHPSAV